MVMWGILQPNCIMVYLDPDAKCLNVMFEAFWIKSESVK